MNINVTPQFILAGDAVYTVSNQNGSHFTYRVTRAKPNPQYPDPTYFLHVLTGNIDDDRDPYTYVGKLILANLDPRVGRDPSLRMTRQSKFHATDAVFKVGVWALQVVWQVAAGKYKLPPGYSIKHEGKCGRCGRALTNPASLDTGLGPECADAVGVEWAERSDRQPTLPEVEQPSVERVAHDPY